MTNYVKNVDEETKRQIQFVSEAYDALNLILTRYQNTNPNNEEYRINVKSRIEQSKKYLQDSYTSCINALALIGEINESKQN